MCPNCLLEDRSGQNGKRFPGRDGLSVYSVKLPMKGEPSVYRQRRLSVISARLSIGISGFLNCCRNVVGRRNPRRNYLGTTVKTIPEVSGVNFLLDGVAAVVVTDGESSKSLINDQWFVINDNWAEHP